ncbi:PEP-CTERM sorting domain-containing protein [Roseateles sp. BYS87W]|uniref:PEP-CTERM sorting domain-containing protein n=1 Tax=Pelomonas baiyunensis TaxID=3299026 RepID=A0ABW7GXV6_9BURK
MNFPLLSKTTAALLLCGLAAHASAAGSVVIDTYGPGNDASGWTSQLNASQRIAVAFDLSAATSIQSILSSIDGWGGVTLGVLARSGSVPGATPWLQSVHLSDPAFNTLLTPTGWNLAAGSYWLVAAPDAGFDGTWQSGTDTPSAAWAFSSNGSWQAVTSGFIGAPALRITVAAAVPEPSTYGLMLAGGLLVAAAARRKSASSSNDQG